MEYHDHSPRSQTLTFVQQHFSGSHLCAAASSQSRYISYLLHRSQSRVCSAAFSSGLISATATIFSVFDICIVGLISPSLLVGIFKATLKASATLEKSGRRFRLARVMAAADRQRKVDMPKSQTDRAEASASRDGGATGDGKPEEVSMEASFLVVHLLTHKLSPVQAPKASRLGESQWKIFAPPPMR